MKKIFLTLCISAMFGMVMAQEVKTYSVYDTNQSGDVTVSDVTEVVDKVKSNVAAASTQQYVTADMLTSLFATILEKFKALESRMSAMEAKVGIETPDIPQQAASFEVAKKSMKVGDTFTQTVTSNSDGTVTYISSNSSVATVDATSGLVTAVANGEAIITAVIAATSTYNALASSYTVLVGESTVGTAKRTGEIDVEWVQLWKDGPKWAVYNIGATSIGEYGGYYCWGKTKNKDQNGSYSSNTSDIQGTSEDTAKNLWGDNWQMPTSTDYENLIANCKIEWSTDYNGTGKSGYAITGLGDYSDNSILFPGAGYYFYGGVSGKGYNGIYWSSTPGYGLDLEQMSQKVSTRNSACCHSVRAILR